MTDDQENNEPQVKNPNPYDVYGITKEDLSRLGHKSRRLDDTISNSDELASRERDFTNLEKLNEKRALAQKLTDIEKVLRSLIVDKNKSLARVRARVELQKNVSIGDFDKLSLKVRTAIGQVLDRLQLEGHIEEKNAHVALPWPDSQRPEEIKKLSESALKIRQALMSFRMDPNNAQDLSGLATKFVEIESNMNGLVAELKNLEDVWQLALKP